MATRKYEQRVRAEQAEQTKRRILDAVEDLLRAHPTGALRLDEVAARAGVARSTIYAVFGSRTGLLDAFADDLWSRSGIAALTAAVDHDDVRAHLREGFAAASRMFAAERDLYRTLFSMAALEPASMGHIAERMVQDRAGGTTRLASRLAEADALRPDTTVEDAAHILWMLSSFESLDLLITGRGLPVEHAIDLLAASAERAVCR